MSKTQDITILKREKNRHSAPRGYVEIYFGWLITLEKTVNIDNSKTEVTSKQG